MTSSFFKNSRQKEVDVQIPIMSSLMKAVRDSRCFPYKGCSGLLEDNFCGYFKQISKILWILSHIYRDVSLSSITSLSRTHTLIPHWEVDDTVSQESVSKNAIKITFISQNSSFGLRSTKGNTQALSGCWAYSIEQDLILLSQGRWKPK